MAGQYFYDPRPFYGHNGSNGLMPLDEVFYGRYEPVPYWMDQRMTPASAFDDYYDPGHKQMAMARQLQQQNAYKRPESRDDLGVDMYRRSPYSFQGMGYGAPQPRQTSQDDTWVHAGNPPHGHGHMMNAQHRPMMDQGYMPNAHARGMDQTHGHNKTNSMGGNMGNHGSHGSQGNYGNQSNTKTGAISSNQFGNKSNGYANGYENVKSSSQGGNSMKQGGNMKQQQQRRYDSSSEDSDEEYENGGNNGVKWATKNSVKHGNGHQNATHMKSGNSRPGGNNHHGSISGSISSYDSFSSKKSGGRKSGGNMISKLLRFQDDDSSSSDSENERYGHNSKKSSSKMSNHGNSFQSHGHQQQNKQMQYGSSQSKGVELKVPICCDNCERKVKECLEYMDGVKDVLCDQWTRKVIVYGNVKPENVLKRVRRVKKTAELWQQGKQQQQQQLLLRAY